jgi:hypothetical protein
MTSDTTWAFRQTLLVATRRPGAKRSTVCHSLDSRLASATLGRGACGKPVGHGSRATPRIHSPARRALRSKDRAATRALKACLPLPLRAPWWTPCSHCQPWGQRDRSNGRARPAGIICKEWRRGWPGKNACLLAVLLLGRSLVLELGARREREHCLDLRQERDRPVRFVVAGCGSACVSPWLPGC